MRKIRIEDWRYCWEKVEIITISDSFGVEHEVCLRVRKFP